MMLRTSACTSIPVLMRAVTPTLLSLTPSPGETGVKNAERKLPFCAWEECKFHINLSMESFYIKLPDGSMLDFPNRLGDIKYKYFSIGGDARIVGIKIK
nr:galectin-2-like [Labrus bergylta]